MDPDDTIAGYIVLVRAVVRLAERDACLIPEKYKNQEQQKDARHHKDEAEWFLGHMNYCRRCANAN